MPVRQLKEFLDRNAAQYTRIPHSTAYTAQEIAEIAHIKGGELAKTVIVKLDETLVMAVVPASFDVDLEKLRLAAGASHATLASEGEFRERFPGCETGAMPPFGNLFHMPVYVDESLAASAQIAFTAGTHNELVRMSYAEYARLVRPAKRYLLVEKAGAHAA